MTEIYVTRPFIRWMRKADISNDVLLLAVTEMQSGLIDADLGRHVFKKRVAVQGRGKRSGARTIVASNHNDRWIFLLGFLKSEQANIDVDEVKAIQELASDYLALNKAEVAVMLASKAWTRLNSNEN